ncbi:MAG: DUF2946 family protein [Stellaceae bacterium]
MRRGVALLGTLGLLLQLALAVVHDPAGARAAAPAGMPWLAGALCTGTGAAMPADDRSGPAPGKAPFCPICLALSLGGVFLLPVIAALAWVLAAALGEPALPAPTWHVVRISLGALARAPPVTV